MATGRHRCGGPIPCKGVALTTGARDPGDVMALLEKAVDAENAVLRNAYFDKTIG